MASLRDRWNAFSARQTHQRVLEWLDKEGIELVTKG